MTGISASTRRSTSSSRLRPPLDLDRLRACFLDEADGVRDALGDGRVIGAIRHVGNHDRPLDGPPHCTRVMEHFVDGDGEGAVETHHDHGQRVADENQIDARFIDDTSGRVVVGGQGRNRLAMTLLFLQMGKSDFCGGFRTVSGAVCAAEMRDTHHRLQCGSLRCFWDATRTISDDTPFRTA